MSHYKPYPAYRDSGVEWIGEVPEHWRVSAVKREFDTQLGKMLQPEQKAESDIAVPYHKAVSVQWENVADTPPETMWASPAEVEQFRIRKGDLLICEGGDVGRAALFKGDDAEPIIIQNSIHRVRAKRGNRNELLLRFMQTVKRSGWFDVLCSKSTIVHFTSEKLGDLPYPVAPPDEQNAITAAINRETARIDALITKKTRFIELLKEKRQALITHAVTKGLDPNVKMKDSGVEWIGEVPEHWIVAPIKRWFVTTSGATPDTSQQAKYYDASDGVPWIRTTDLNNGLVEDYELGITDEAIRDTACKRLPVGSILIAMYGGEGTIGKNGRLGIVACINQAICALLPTKSFDIDFAFAYIQFYRPHWMADAASTRKDPNISQDLIRSAPVVCPPVEEQRRIARHLGTHLARIDILTEKTQRSIDLLKERRAAFITAAVTGQIDLRESA